jgi:hypothetical protein
MTLRRAYAPLLPELDAFLFASIGEEVDGVPLSVLSALSRLGLDPRDEAARLARLTKDAAADQLATLMARLYDRRWSASEAWRIASALVEHLPKAKAAANDASAARGAGRAIGSRASPFLIYLAMTVAMLVILIARGYLSFGG